MAARGSPQKHIWRAQIVLLSDDGLGAVAILAATGRSKTCVGRWQERFMADGLDGLLRDTTRPPGIAPLETALVDKLVPLTLGPPAHEATHWTVRAIAKAVGIAASSVVKIWHNHGLAPHRWRSFKLSNDRTRRRLKNGVSHSVVDLQAAINRFIKGHNQQPRPFVWRADPSNNIAAVRRGHQTLESIR